MAACGRRRSSPSRRLAAPSRSTASGRATPVSLRLRSGSFHYLKTAPGFFDDPAESHLRKAVGGLARALRLRFVVTGVDSERELSDALDAGADFVEGFHFGRPSDTPTDAEPSLWTFLDD